MAVLCEDCLQNPATVHITKIINNEKTEQNLCENCARRYQNKWGLENKPSFSIPKFFASLLEDETGFGKTVSESYPRETKCGRCGQTYREFTQTGRMGCNRCYDFFGDRLNPLLRRIHGSTRHTGKVPKRAGGKLRLKRELEKLRSDLKKLVAKEEFERAAEVRDRIRELENQVKR